MRLTWFAALVVAAFLAGCAGEPGPSRVVPAPGRTTAKWTERDIEFKLASIDRHNIVDGNDPLIDVYERALDAADSKCEEGRQQLADMAVKATQMLEERNQPFTALEMLTGVDKVVLSEMAPMKCAEIMAAVVTLSSPLQLGSDAH